MRCGLIIMWSKNFDKRPHRRARIFFHGDNVMWHRPVGGIAVGCSSRAVECLCLHCRFNYPFCCIHLCRDSQLCFSMGCPTPEIATPRGDLDLHLICSSLGPHESGSKQHLDQFIHFCSAHSCHQPTESVRDTDHATCTATYVAIGRISSEHMMWAIYDINNIVCISIAP